MDAHGFKARLKRKQPLIGTWSHIPSVQVVEVIGAAGLDFIVFDMEHGPCSFSDMPALYCAAEASGLVPVTRVPGPDNSNVLRTLDSGAKGIMMPHVENAAMARRCLETMFYGDQPLSRGVATLTRSSRFDYKNEQRHLATQNELVISILMIENQAGLDDLDAICALPGLDVVFVGVYDLAQSFGVGGDLDDPDFERLYARTIERVQAHDVAVGCYAATADAARRLLDMGVGVITINVDGAMLRRSYETALEQLPGRG